MTSRQPTAADGQQPDISVLIGLASREDDPGTLRLLDALRSQEGGIRSEIIVAHGRRDLLPRTIANDFPEVRLLPAEAGTSLPALRTLAFGALLLYAAAVSALVLLPNNSVVLVYVLILGLAQGLFGGLGNTVWVRYYGRKHLGKIRGSVWTAAVAGSSIGPFLMGVSYDKQGDFYSSLTVIAIILIALAIDALWATPPKIQDPSPA